MLNDKLINVEHLRKWFPVGGLFSVRALRGSKYVKAVNDFSFDIRQGEVFGLVGESGCGKTTVGRLIMGLIRPTEGRVFYKDIDTFSRKKEEKKRLRQEMQIIFQDPYDSLSDRMKIYDIIAEPLRIHRLCEDKEAERRTVCKVMEDVNLTPTENLIGRLPGQLSGGQAQRVAIARALVLKPKFVVADEPVSMLDVSTRAGVLDLMLDLRKKADLSYLFITHDLAVARYMCDRIAVAYLGKEVEIGPAAEIISHPLHPYTNALVSVVPVPNPNLHRERILLSGEIPNPINPPSGCMFHPRCRYAMEVCRLETPEVVEAEKNHYVACHLIG